MSFQKATLSEKLLFGYVITVISIIILVSLICGNCVDGWVKAMLLATSLIAVLFGWKQLKANHDWNRRSLTITKLQELIEKLREYRMNLDRLTTENKIIEFHGKYISFTDRVNFFGKHKDSQGLTADELHAWVCAKDDEEFDYIKDTSDNKVCKTTKVGEEIVHNILMIINTYESIATGVKHRVYDEEIVLDLLENGFSKNYDFFKMYIKHRREKHDAAMFAENFENFYKKIEKKKEDGVKERRPTDA